MGEGFLFVNVYFKFVGDQQVNIITVEVRDDHLENLAQTKPMAALAELIWNALDAEATEIRVEFVENALQGLEAIQIVDNGHGLPYEEAFSVFRNLGGSWKREGKRTQQRKRELHGKFGKGRFRAFSLGNNVHWHSTYTESGKNHSFTLSGSAETLGTFQVDKLKENVDNPAGMTVEIIQSQKTADLLRGVKAMEEVTNIFALYLRQYPDTKIIYDGIPLDSRNAESRFSSYTLAPMVMENGEKITCTMDVVEWNRPGKRGVVLCDGQGFMRINALPRLYFRGFSYTAYVKSDHIATLDGQGLLYAGELYSDLRQILDAARAQLREHFALREAEDAQSLLEYWKETGMYPYVESAQTEMEANERRIFDIYATHLDRIFSDFSSGTSRMKRLILRMVQELVHADPRRVAAILDELLSFPEEIEEKISQLAASATGGEVSPKDLPTETNKA